MKIAIASKNPCKITAAKKAFSKFFKNVEFISREAESMVSEQPKNKEVFLGAKNRAQNISKIIEADYYIGVESGVIEIFSFRFISTVACIYDKRKFYFGLAPCFMLPKEITEKLLEGVELAKIAEKITGKKDIRKKEGMIGYITNNVVIREDLNYFAVLMALASYFGEKKLKH